MNDSHGRLLLADDDGLFLDGVVTALRNLGYECDSAADVSAARDLLRTREYDALITEVGLAGGDDLQLVREAEQVQEDLFVVLLTGTPSIAAAATAFRLPVIDYLVKPVGIDTLAESAGRAVGRHRLRNAVRDQLQRARDWSSRLETVAGVLRVPRGAEPVPVDEFLDLVLDHLAGLLLDWRQLTRFLAASRPGQHTCGLLNCPRTATFLSALQDTVAVLEQTKGAFRSKDLGQLRRRIEALLDQAGQPDIELGETTP